MDLSGSEWFFDATNQGYPQKRQTQHLAAKPPALPRRSPYFRDRKLDPQSINPKTGVQQTNPAGNRVHTLAARPFEQGRPNSCAPRMAVEPYPYVGAVLFLEGTLFRVVSLQQQNHQFGRPLYISTTYRFHRIWMFSQGTLFVFFAVLSHFATVRFRDCTSTVCDASNCLSSVSSPSPFCPRAQWEAPSLAVGSISPCPHAETKSYRHQDTKGRWLALDLFPGFGMVPHLSYMQATRSTQQMGNGRQQNASLPSMENPPWPVE